MTTTTHKTTRRALLGAIAAAPVAAAIPAAAMAKTRIGRGEWDAAMNRWQKIKTEYDSASARYHRTADTYESLTGYHPFKSKPFQRIEPEAGRLSGWSQAEHVVEELGESLHDAHSALLTTPAPDKEALLWKLEQLFEGDARDPDGYCASWCADFVNSFMADARRLLGRA